MENQVTNNKEMVPMEQYLEDYRKADPAEMAERTQTPYDSERQVFTLRFLHRDYEITWPEFSAKVLDDSDLYSPLLSTNQTKILVLRYLLECASVESKGNFMTYRDVPWGEVYFRQFNGRCQKRMEFSYGVSPAKMQQFCEKMEKLGSVKVERGDAGYQFEMFPGFYVQFLMWAGDEEFPPSSQILFSDNYAAAFHAEDLVVVCEVMIGAMKNA